MANADIVVVGMRELPLIVELFNEVFRPPRDIGYFERRLRGRVQSLLLVAQIDNRPAGFAVGYEIKPGTFYCWLIGVHSDLRRAGIASQLMEAMAAWSRDNGYHTIRFECYNRHRPMLHLAISHNYDIVGLRFDPDAGANLIIFEHVTSDASDEDDIGSG